MFCQSCGTNVADGVAFCTSCGRPIVGYAVGQPGGAGAIAMSTPVAVATATTTNFAGFWLRVVAAILDSIIVAVPSGPIFLLMFASALPALLAARNGGNPAFLVVQLFSRFMFFLVVVMIVQWLYWALMESSSWQATLGKKALGLYVTDLEGNRITFGKASGRFWSGRGITIVPSLGGLYFLVDCICCGFTEKKQAVHDMIAGCLVMRKV